MRAKRSLSHFVHSFTSVNPSMHFYVATWTSLCIPSQCSFLVEAPPNKFFSSQNNSQGRSSQIGGLYGLNLAQELNIVLSVPWKCPYGRGRSIVQRNLPTCGPFVSVTENPSQPCIEEKHHIGYWFAHSFSGATPWHFGFVSACDAEDDYRGRLHMHPVLSKSPLQIIMLRTCGWCICSTPVLSPAMPSPLGMGRCK
jgi:hypothetical protein